MFVMGFLLLFAWFCGLLNLYVKAKYIRKHFQYLQSTYGGMNVADDFLKSCAPVFSVLANALYAFAALSVFVAMAFFALLVSTAV